MVPLLLCTEVAVRPSMVGACNVSPVVGVSATRMMIVPLAEEAISACRMLKV